jgi:hypothetical protein
MSRKRYTQKGLESTVNAARERHERLEAERIARTLGGDPLELAAALTRESHIAELEAAEHAYVAEGLEQFETLLAQSA